MTVKLDLLPARTTRIGIVAEIGAGGTTAILDMGVEFVQIAYIDGRSYGGEEGKRFPLLAAAFAA